MMRDIDRIPVIMDALKSCWTTLPDLRFGQLVENIVSDYKGEENLISDLWNMEEDEWLKAIQSFSEYHKGQWIDPTDKA